MISTRMKIASGALALGTALVFAAPQPADAQRWHRHHHRHGGGWGGPAAAGIAGFATGAIIGGALASQPNYYGGGYGPAPAYGGADPNAVAYCQQRFKSYDPASGTYLGYDGVRHSCP